MDGYDGELWTLLKRPFSTSRHFQQGEGPSSDWPSPDIAKHCEDSLRALHSSDKRCWVQAQLHRVRVHLVGGERVSGPAERRGQAAVQVSGAQLHWHEAA